MGNLNKIIYTPPFSRRGFIRHLSDGREIPVSPTVVTRLPSVYSKTGLCANNSLDDICTQSVSVLTNPARVDSANLNFSWEKTHRNASKMLADAKSISSLDKVAIGVGVAGTVALSAYIIYKHNKKKQGGISSVQNVAKEEGQMETCTSCQQEYSRSRLSLTLPWEDGNNPNAYWTCPNCGCENIVYGYGEDN